MKEEPKVSVIITTHNRLNLLKKAVNSVLNQTYKNIEIIVVDDCSNDDTNKFCNSIKEIKYIFINKNEHKNGNYARNKGIKMCDPQSKYVAFLDDDDEWFPEKIERQVKKFNSNKEIGMVYTSVVMDFNEGKYKYIDYINVKNHGDCSKISLYNIISSTSTLMFRKDVLLACGGFDENLNYWQDNEIIINVCQKYKIDYINEPLVKYRVILNDKHKLSNNIDGFIESVNYINNKYKKQIAKLSENELKQRKIMIYNTISNRYASIGDKNKSKQFLYYIFKEDKKIKSLIKFLINYNYLISKEGFFFKIAMKKRIKRSKKIENLL